jgi:hypothetical protein
MVVASWYAGWMRVLMSGVSGDDGKGRGWDGYMAQHLGTPPIKGTSEMELVTMSRSC